MYYVPDHPVIRNLMNTGYPDGKPPVVPHCPVCDSECDRIYFHMADVQILGCENCLLTFNAADETACGNNEYPVCPVCGQICEDVYKDSSGQIQGCDSCITSKDAINIDDCLPCNPFE